MYKVLEDNFGRKTIITNKIPYWTIHEERQADELMDRIAPKIKNYLENHVSR